MTATGLFLDVVSFGVEAVPELRNLLFQREPSGLYLVRRRAVEALAALKSFDTLGEFLRLDREIDDPVERLGEEVVVSTAARLIAQLREEWVFQLLLGLAKRRGLSGVLAGLGAFKRPESIPCLVRALTEEDLRPTAEGVLRSFGRAARPQLVWGAIHSIDPIRPDSETACARAAARSRSRSKSVCLERNGRSCGRWCRTTTFRLRCWPASRALESALRWTERAPPLVSPF